MRTVFADLGERATWRAGGERPLAFLHDVLTQDVADLTPGTGRLAALLNEKGRLRAVVRVLALGAGGVLLDADPAARDGIEAGIVRLAPLGGAELIEEPRRLFRLAGSYPGAPGSSEHDHDEQDGAIVVRTYCGVDVLAPIGGAGEWLERLRAIAGQAEPHTLDAARIRAGRPVFGLDCDDDTLVNETPLLALAVSFAKGCYPGQESVARVHNLGHVRRTLMPIAIESPDEPPPGTDVFAPGRTTAGRITSSAHDEQGTVAFAMLDAKAADAGALLVGNEPASVLPV